MKAKIFILLAIILSSCRWEPQKASVLVIAVDSLSFESFRCLDNEKMRGLKTICEEMVRFTHAYTPSALSQPALTSLLTGKYPFEHGVWNNGSSFLSARFKTNSEIALENDYRTLFISGGPPIWRKSGLDQGFEDFNDHINVDYSKYYRPVFDSLRFFISWLENDVKNSPFYSVIYVPDLQFKDLTTVDNEGFPREASYEGQLSELDESLDFLFEALKKNKRWKNTWVVFTGLNGISKEARLRQFNGTNLFHENTNVALYIKPATTKEHEKSNWKIDGNVTLVDVGRTIYTLLGGSFQETHQTIFKSIDLKNSVLAGKEVDSSRVILFESGWPQWRKQGKTLFALQKENYLMTYEKPPKIYNTLVDRQQIYPIDYQKQFQYLADSAKDLVSLLNIQDDSSEMSDAVIEKMRLSNIFLGRNSFNKEYLSVVEDYFKNTSDKEVAGWLATYYLKNQMWRELKEIGAKVKELDWIWIAEKNLNQLSIEPSICLKEAVELKQASKAQIQCSDYLMNLLFKWMISENQRDFIYFRDQFIKNYRVYRIDYEIQKMNYQNGYVWDTAKDKIISPHIVDIALAIPDMLKYKNVVNNQF